MTSPSNPLSQSSLSSAAASDTSTAVAPAPARPKGGMRAKIQLTVDQARAASFGLGTRAVVATAGSGKTTTMSYRIASLMEEQGIPDYQILATTFTNAGAEDLKARIDSMAGRKTDIQAGTLHSFCVKLVFIYASELGYDGAPTILDERQKKAQIEQLMLQVTQKTSIKDVPFSYEDVLHWLGELATRDFTSDPRDQSIYTIGKKLPAAISEICRLYRERSSQYGYMDFDSILSEALRLLKKAPEPLISALPKYVFIDEAQDLSAIQWFIIEELSRHARSLDIIGDDDQSIYGWRAALPWRFRNFVEKADQKFFLSANRRCASSIVRLAAQIVGTIPPSRRIAKDLSAVREVEGLVRFSVMGSLDSVSLIAKKINSEVLSGAKNFGDFALIVRAKTHVFAATEGAFKRAAIPYKLLGGKSTFDSPESRLMRAAGHLAIKKEGKEPLAHWTSLFSDVGISPDAVDKLIKEAQAMGGDRGVSLNGLSWAAKRSRMAERNRKTSELLIEAVASLRSAERPTVRQLFNNHSIWSTALDIIQRRCHIEVETERKKGGMTEQQAKEKFEKISKERAERLKTSMSSMMDDSLASAMVALDLNSEDDDDGAPKVTLSTAHSSKGLEWDTVFVMEANRVTWPSQRSGRGLGNVPPSVHQDLLDEERRLLYVAVTRAKNELYLTSTVLHPASGSPQAPSEFLPKWLTSLVLPAFNTVCEEALRHEELEDRIYHRYVKHNLPVPEGLIAQLQELLPKSQGIKIDVPQKTEAEKTDDTTTRAGAGSFQLPSSSSAKPSSFSLPKK